MQAIILAGGVGKRLRPYTTVFPKPLMPIGDKPILEIVLNQLKKSGFNNVTMAVGHLAQLIQAFCGTGEQWGLKINYSKEDKPLGTAGPLSLIDNFDDNFLAMNGDLLTTFDFKDAMEYHTKNDNFVTIAVFEKETTIPLGVLEYDKDNLIQSYTEKPTYKHNVSMGIYIFKKEVSDYLKKNEHLDFPDLIKTLIKDNKRVGAYPFKGEWLDIGRNEDFFNAIDKYNEKKDLFLKEAE